MFLMYTKGTANRSWRSHFSFLTSHYSFRSKSDWSMSQTTGRGDGRQEGCESGYYDLHRYLNNTIRLHNFHFSKFKVLRPKGQSDQGRLQSSKFKVQSVSSAPGHRLSCLRCRRCHCSNRRSGFRHSGFHCCLRCRY